MALIFFSQLAIQVIEYSSLKTITKTHIDSIDNDLPIVTFMFKDNYPTIFHEVHKYQFNEDMLDDYDRFTRPINRSIDEIKSIFNGSLEVMLIPNLLTHHSIQKFIIINILLIFKIVKIMKNNSVYTN